VQRRWLDKEILTGFSWRHPTLSLAEMSNKLLLPKPTDRCRIDSGGILETGPVTKRDALGLSIFELGMRQSGLSTMLLRSAHPGGKR